MTRKIILFIISIFALAPQIAEVQAVENPIFGYTHLLPSPFTLPAGRVIVGTTSGIGITDYLELDTDVVANFFKLYNAKARFSLLDFPGFAAGLSFGYQYYNPNDFLSSSPSVSIHSFMPGGVFGIEVAPYLALFFGGNLLFTSVDIPTPNVSTVGYLKGAEIETDLSWAYNPKEKQIGNIVAAGFTYNTTFGFYGIGLSHHWKKFRLGLHYYPNASSVRVIPLISGGAVIDI